MKNFILLQNVQKKCDFLDLIDSGPAAGPLKVAKPWWQSCDTETGSDSVEGLGF